MRHEAPFVLQDILIMGIAVGLVIVIIAAVVAAIRFAKKDKE